MDEVIRLKLQKRLLDHTRRGKNGCLLWTASTAGGGYGLTSAKHRGVKVQIPAHRAAWEVFVGPIPPGAFVCHRCDVRRCVEPTHLFLGTQKANLVDCARKGRVRNAKLSPEQAAHVFTSCAPHAYLAKHYGVCVEVVKKIRKRRSYAWATEGAIRGSSF